MGTDKAFLELGGKPFIAIITEAMLQAASEVLVMTGRKDEAKFRAILDRRVRVSPDTPYLSNPLGGMLSAFPLITREYSAFLACDAPLVRPALIRLLHGRAIGYDAGVPVWEDGRIEPLCAVYNVRAAMAAGQKALAANELGGRHLIAHLSRVRYVPVEELRRVDPSLESFMNVNSREELEALRSRRREPEPSQRPRS
jgi:molybdopterin-guanine dinucleotide biosynthesis protein A